MPNVNEYDLKWASQPPVMESEELDGGARHPGAVGQGEVGQPGQADRNLNSVTDQDLGEIRGWCGRSEGEVTDVLQAGGYPQQQGVREGAAARDVQPLQK